LSCWNDAIGLESVEQKHGSFGDSAVKLNFFRSAGINNQQNLDRPF
jgi:hypothetical protein